MTPENLSLINQSFSIQASNFDSPTLQFSKADYLNHVLEAVSPAKSDLVLEVAAGTAACGRTFSPAVKTVVCLDATLPMLEAGKAAADKSGLTNLIFEKGFAEDLPFLSRSFDLVMSRLAFHHFSAPAKAFEEMVRVLKPEGRLIMIDMEASPEPDRAARDEIERMRDPSHVSNLTKDDMEMLFESEGLSIEHSDTVRIEQHLESWMGLTRTPPETEKAIRGRMEAELSGGPKTGFAPYRKEDEICFEQRWVLTIGRKSA